MQNNAPRYPAVDTGIPLTSVEEMLATQEHILARIRIAVADDQVYEQTILPVIRNYARFVHLLPATRTEHFRGAGGLFTMGLHVGFFTMQATDSMYFSGKERTEDRPFVEPAWRQAGFFAGLCSEIALGLRDLTVATEDGTQWPVYLTPLLDWCEAHGASRYYVRWQEPVRRHQALTTFYDMAKIIPQHAIQQLQTISPRIVQSMLDAVTGIADITDHNRLAQAIRRIRVALIERDLKANAERYGTVMVGAHLEPYFIAAIRELVRNGTWKVNQAKARLWYSTEGIFLIWPTAAKEMIELLAAQQIAGVPRDPDTIAEILERSGAILSGNEGLYWTIYPSGDHQKSFRAVRLVDLALLSKDHTSGQWPPLDRPLLTAKTTKISVKSVTKGDEAGSETKPVASMMASEANPDTAEDDMPEDLSSLPEKSTAKPPKSAAAKSPNRQEPRPAAQNAKAPSQAEQRPSGAVKQLAGAKRALIEFVDALREDVRANPSCVIPIQEGVAIPFSLIEQYGLEVDAIRDQLLDMNWLHLNNGKPAMRVEIDGEKDFSLVMLNQVAKELEIVA